MANLAVETKDMGFQLEQVQGFTPTPMTVATIIYYSGYHPYTLKKTYTPKSKQEKDEQHRFFFWYKKENQAWIRNTLNKVNRNDLLEKLLPSYGKKTRQQKEKRVLKGKSNSENYQSVLGNSRHNKKRIKSKKR